MEISNTDTVRISDAEFHMIADFVYREFGIRFADQKKSLVEGRLSKVWKEGEYRSIRSYLDDVKNDQSGRKLQEMMNRLTTNHSYFFRENQLLTYFSQNGGFQSLGFMPHQANPDIRIWSAGCSEGQEPYSIAITLLEYFGSNLKPLNPLILATDISERALMKAVNGIYTKSEIDENVNKLFLNHYFDSIDRDRFQVKKTIRDMILFRRFNLNNEVYPFKNQFDIIYCRNVMIYFDSESKEKIISKFYRYVKPGGYLVIGCSESLNNLKHPFKQVAGSIYRKIEKI